MSAEDFEGSGEYFQCCKCGAFVRGDDCGTHACTSHWDEIKGYPVSDWKYEVSNDDTRLGYADWAEHKKWVDIDMDKHYVCPKCGGRNTIYLQDREHECHDCGESYEIKT